MKLAVTSIPPFSMRVGSTSLGVLTLLVIALVWRRRIRISGWTNWLHIAVAGILNIACFGVFSALALLSAETSRVAFLTYTMPVWTVLFAIPVLGERLTPMRIVALVCCVGGVGILVYPLADSGVPVALLLALATGMTWAAGTVYLKKVRIAGDPVAMTLWQLVAGLAVVAAVMVVVEGAPTFTPLLSVPTLAMIFSGLVGSGLAYFLWFNIVGRVPAMTASLGVLSVPVVGMLSSMLILGDRPTPMDYVGFVLIFAAAACVLLRPGE
jgi:drug/metabolite transporter (DMT)-like permease